VPRAGRGPAPASGEPRIRFAVRVIPRAGRNAIDAVREGELVVRLAAAPAEGAANEALVALVAKALGVPPTSVRIERGGSGRHKLLSAPAAAGTRLAALVR